MQRTKIIRSSTPTHIFSTIHTDIDLTNSVDDIEVFYIQDKSVVFCKKMSDGDVSVESKTKMVVELTEEDTNSLDPTIKVYIRPLLVLPGDKRIPSANTICALVEDL